MEMLISFSSRTWHLHTLPKVPKAGSMTMMLLCLIGQQTHQTWTHRESMRYCQEKNETQWETPDSTMQMTRRPLSKQPGLHYTGAVPQADHLHAMLHSCSNSCKKRPNQVLSAYKWTYFSEAWHFCLKYHFLLILCYILIFRDTEFWVVIICKS